MMQIDCPFCGRRDETEFSYGGEAHLERPALGVNDERWAEYLFFRNNVKGVHAERWRHTRGCGQWFNALRNTATHRFHAFYRITEPRPAMAPDAQLATAAESRAGISAALALAANQASQTSGVAATEASQMSAVATTQTSQTPAVAATEASQMSAVATTQTSQTPAVASTNASQAPAVAATRTSQTAVAAAQSPEPPAVAPAKATLDPTTGLGPSSAATGSY